MTKRIWPIIPAAGIGSRMASAVPKQYLPILGKPILQQTLERIAGSIQHEVITVAIHPDDSYWHSEIDCTGLSINLVKGGGERCDSVLNALTSIQPMVDKDDWVLVHDAARPCVRREDIVSLFNELEKVGHGGILAAPVKDTMKRSNRDNVVTETINRERMWHALTPQAFPFQTLFDALTTASNKGVIVTDEAMAIETVGGKVLLVEGSQDNIKITRPEDLALATLYLQAQQTSTIKQALEND